MVETNTNDKGRMNRIVVLTVGLALALVASGCLNNPGGSSGVDVTGESLSIRFAVDMNDAIASGWFDPDTETVGVRGELSPLSWAQTVQALDDDRDGVFETDVTFSTIPDSPIAFKFKVDGDDNPDDGWQVGANRWLDPASSLVYSSPFEEAARSRPVTFSGNVVTHEDFKVPGSGLVPRSLYVYLPPGYEQSEERYPVLYMHDGRNIFDASEVGAEWKMDEHAEKLIEDGSITAIIIVGIGNTIDRTTEYTPSEIEGYEEGGGGDQYGKLVVEGVKPFIDEHYRTMPDRDNTTLGGSSLGGLISMYLGLQYPRVFGQLLIVSPSVWWNDQEIVRTVNQLPGPTGQRIWLDMGAEEGDDMVTGAAALRDALRARGWTDENLTYLEVAKAGHSERAWADRSQAMLKFLYGPDN